MPIEFPDDGYGLGAWRNFVLAAGLADAVSRTVTAPIDRLKTQLQVRLHSVFWNVCLSHRSVNINLRIHSKTFRKHKHVS